MNLSRQPEHSRASPQDSEGRTRRWVIYKGYAEASAIPAGWHGWIHHRAETPPSRETYKAHAWEKTHQPNLTGSAAAYRPKGSIAHGDNRPHRLSYPCYPPAIRP